MYRKAYVSTTCLVCIYAFHIFEKKTPLARKNLTKQLVLVNSYLDLNSNIQKNV